MADTDLKPGKIDDKTGKRVATDAEIAAAYEKHPKTGPDTHRATQLGYAIDPATGAGVLVPEGDVVPADQPVSDAWMEKIGKKDRALAGATDEALDPHPKDVDLTKLDKAALQAMAAERGINVDGLGPKDLISAINAHREKDAG